MQLVTNETDLGKIMDKLTCIPGGKEPPLQNKRMKHGGCFQKGAAQGVRC